MGRITIYLNQLKNKTGYTQQQLSEFTNIPQGTIPRYFRGMDDDSANFEVVRKLVTAMGGSLDELAGIAPKQLEISQEKLAEDGYTETEIKAILRWAGSEISRSYQAVVAALEARIAEKDNGWHIEAGLWWKNTSAPWQISSMNESGLLFVLWLLSSHWVRWRDCL